MFNRNGGYFEEGFTFTFKQIDTEMFGQTEGTEPWNHGGHRAKEPFSLPSTNLILCQVLWLRVALFVLTCIPKAFF